MGSFPISGEKSTLWGAGNRSISASSIPILRCERWTPGNEGSISRPTVAVEKGSGLNHE